MNLTRSFWQIIRFGISGVALTALVSLLYLIAIRVISPALALTLATLIASIAGYFIHSAFSFRGHGGRDQPAIRFARFLITNSLGYALNLFFVYLMIDLGHLPKWSPVIAFAAVTPAASFILNRHWVFG